MIGIAPTFVISSLLGRRVTTMHQNIQICCTSAAAGGSSRVLTQATISPNYRFWLRARSASPIMMPIRAPDPPSAPQHTRQKTQTPRQRLGHKRSDTSTGTQNNHWYNINTFTTVDVKCKKFITGHIALIASAGCQIARIAAQRSQHDNPSEPRDPLTNALMEAVI